MIRFLKTGDVKSPERGTVKSAGIDFFVPNDFNNGQPLLLAPGEDVLIPSGIIVGLPENTMLMGADKSGIASSSTAKKLAGITPKKDAHDTSLIVGAKIIDEDYPGELHIHIINVGRVYASIRAGMKIAQFILVPIRYDSVIEVKNFSDLQIPQTERTGGFSSTNK